MFVIHLIDTKQKALLILPHVSKTLEVDGHGHLEIQLFELGDRVGHKVVVVQRRDRQFDPCHASDLLGPKTRCVNDMFAIDRAFFGHNLPAF